LGLSPQPSQKSFEAFLWNELRRIPPGKWALAEGESRNIGKLTLPLRVYESLQIETSLWIEASLDYRVKVILEDYPAIDELKAAFVAPIQALKRRLGGETVERLLGLLHRGKWEDLVRDLMVFYYDPLYAHTKPKRRVEICIESEEEGFPHLKAAIKQVLDCSMKGEE
jgi:tRNA 2-selenouridine synthase